MNYRAVATAVIAMALASVPWWGVRALSTFDFFHARTIMFEGVRRASAAELLHLLAVDTTQSVWQDLVPLEDRVASHPLVLEASVERMLPGTFVVRIREREPIALVMKNGFLRPTDVRGMTLPLDPTLHPLDVPVSGSADSTLLQLLDSLRRESPALYARISQAERMGSPEFRFRLGTLTVRTMPDVTVRRFRDILPVEADLARNQLRAVELDLRFRDQVIARQP